MSNPKFRIMHECTAAKMQKFRKWLKCFACLEELAVTNPYEVMRFAYSGGRLVVYQNGAGQFSGNNEDVLTAFQCFKDGVAPPFKTRRGKRGARDQHVHTLLLRDGACCFYCGKHMTTAEATLEHLFDLSRGGLHRVENEVLACQPCNTEAQHLCVAEKVIMRDRKRGHPLPTEEKKTMFLDDLDDFEEETPTIIENFTVEHETEKALLVSHRRGKFWVPKLMVIERSDDVLAINGSFDIKYEKKEKVS